MARQIDTMICFRACLYRLVPLAAILFATGAIAAPPPVPAPVPAAQSYATLARLYLVSPIVARAQVRAEAKIGRKESALLPPLPAGQGRQWLTIDVQNVLKAPAALPARIGLLWQGPLDPGNKLPKWRKKSLILFMTSAASPGGATSYGMSEVGAAFGWTDGDEALLRQIASEASDPAKLGLAIRSLRSAFVTLADGDTSGRYVHFLFQTAVGQPLVAIVDQQRNQWRLRTTTTDLDQDATPVLPGTLLWYHLACGLPQTPPEAATRQATTEESQLAAAAWTAMLATLGPCR
jgi:hypothetical protein